MLPPENARLKQAQDRVGSSLRDKIRLDSLLGVGGMAAVYTGTHRNAMRVAVKMLHPELSLIEEARTRFVREGYAANRVDHPGAVSVLDDDVTDEGHVFLVMELLVGETLEARKIKLGGALDPAEVVAYADQILDVLIAAHEHQIVHRDLKPENIFLTTEGRIKVLDFGLARLLEQSKDARLTASNAGIMGTPAFLPPEQARGRWEDIDGRTDLWALGATMFTLLTGRDVHAVSTLSELLIASMTHPAPGLLSVAPELPAALARVVDTALAFDKSSRFPDARAMQRALREAAPLVTSVPRRPVFAAPQTPPAAPTLVSASDPRSGQSLSPDPETRRWSSGGGVASGRSRLALYAAAGGLVAAAALAILVWQLSRAAPSVAADVTPSAPVVEATARAPTIPTVSPVVAVAAASTPSTSAPAPQPSSVKRPGAPPRAPAGASTAPSNAGATTGDQLLDRRN
jgi:serine/threonine-protein kinase